MEVTSHVQRFNYTRMLFAKMEEESRLAQEREKVMRRKVSPAHTPSSPCLLYTSDAADES